MSSARRALPDPPRKDHFALALLADVPILRASAGFVGTSDGWQDLAQHRDLA